MILTTHAVAGAAVASLNPSRPIAGFFAGFVLHFILDAIPHWEYRIKSGFIDPKVGAKFSYERAFLMDVLRIGSDFLFGIILSLVIFWPSVSVPVILAGVFGGITPDAFQFIYGRTRWRWLSVLQKFHEWIHSPYKKLIDMPLLGIPLQIFILATIVFAAKLM